MEESSLENVAVFRVYLNPKLMKCGIRKYSRQYIDDVDLSDIKNKKQFDNFLISFGFGKISNTDAETPNRIHLQFNPRGHKGNRKMFFDKKIADVKIMSNHIYFVNNRCKLKRYLDRQKGQRGVG